MWCLMQWILNGTLKLLLIFKSKLDEKKIHDTGECVKKQINEYMLE